MKVSNESGKCVQVHNLKDAVLYCYGSDEAYMQAERELGSSALEVVHLVASARVGDVCNGCIFRRPNIRSDDPRTGYPSVPVATIKTGLETFTTAMRCNRMMASSCIQIGQKTACSEISASAP